MLYGTLSIPVDCTASHKHHHSMMSFCPTICANVQCIYCRSQRVSPFQIYTWQLAAYDIRKDSVGTQQEKPSGTWSGVHHYPILSCSVHFHSGYHVYKHRLRSYENPSFPQLWSETIRNRTLQEVQRCESTTYKRNSGSIIYLVPPDS
jgi:hypothetical protein